MADLSRIKLLDGKIYSLKDTASRDAINSLALDIEELKSQNNGGVEYTFNLQNLFDGYKLPVGTLLQDHWTDIVHEKTYDLIWRINHYENDGVWLQSTYVHPIPVPFAARIKAYTFTGSIASGTQKSIKNGEDNYYYCFTLPCNVSMNDYLCFSDNNIEVYTSNNILKGVTPYKYEYASSSYPTGYPKLTALSDRQKYGNPRWKYSLIRQYLNSNARVGEWWQATESDQTSSQPIVNKYAGFLTGISDELRNIITSYSSQTYYEYNSYEYTEDLVTLPSTGQLNVFGNYHCYDSGSSASQEGFTHSFWKIKFNETNYRSLDNMYDLIYWKGWQALTQYTIYGQSVPSWTRTGYYRNYSDNTISGYVGAIVTNVTDRETYIPLSKFAASSTNYFTPMVFVSLL